MLVLRVYHKNYRASQDLDDLLDLLLNRRTAGQDNSRAEYERHLATIRQPSVYHHAYPTNRLIKEQ